MSSVPEFIGKAYRLHEKLGEGSMGSVYRATHRLTGRIVALKRVRSMQEPEDVANENTARESPWSQNSIALRMSLAEEFQTLASLRHPHIVAVLDYGFDEQQDPYFTMELLRSPKNVLEWCRNQSIDFKIKILVHLLRALTYLHQRGILHRDIKPSENMRCYFSGKKGHMRTACGQVVRRQQLIQGKGMAGEGDPAAIYCQVSYSPECPKSSSEWVAGCITARSLECWCR